MIWNIVFILFACVVATMPWMLVQQDKKIKQQEEMITNLAMKIAKMDESMFNMTTDVEKVRKDQTQEEIEKRVATEVAEKIEKRWDDALQSIFDYDPFKGEGMK